MAASSPSALPSRLRRAASVAFAGVLFCLGGCDAALGGGEISILDVEPRAGTVQGEQPIKILGANFRTDIGYTVFFGNKPSQRVVIVDPGTLLAFSPTSEEPGTVDIHIRADNGEAWVIHDVFEYQPMAGVPAAGGAEGAPGGGGLAY
ncbi:MAG: IPT/TIG domain-containing protein [Myxococcota bacterium]